MWLVCNMASSGNCFRKRNVFCFIVFGFFGFFLPKEISEKLFTGGVKKFNILDHKMEGRIQNGLDFIENMSEIYFND